MNRRLIFFLFSVAVALSFATPFQAQTNEAPPPQKAVFAGGCFWCMQPPFDHTAGVISTVLGYAGGREENPTYKQVSAGETSHRESIEVTYDPTKVTYAALLDVFWRNINPIQTDGQFHDYLKNRAAYGIYHFGSGRDSFKKRFWGL